MDSQENIFVSLSSKNEILMGEMKEYLASLAHSQGDETNCGSENKKPDNIPASSEGSSSSSAKSATSDETDIIRKGKDDSGREESWKKKAGRKGLNSIDEDGGGDNQVEYYNDFNYDAGTYRSPCVDGNQFDDDSLVAMAKRMDAASIISDPSTICGPTEKILALPQPKAITVGIKKLSQKINGVNRKPPPPSTKTAGTAFEHNELPHSPPSRNPERKLQQQGTHGNVGVLENDRLANASSLRLEHCPSSGSPSSSNENVDLGSAAALETLHDYIPEESRTNDKQAQQQAGRIIASSSNSESASEGGRAVCRLSGKKNRKCNIPPTPQNRGGNDGEAPSYPMPAAYALSADGHANNLKKKSKSRRGSHARRRKGERKKRQQKRDNESDGSMCGIGFNTRIHEKPELDNEPNNTVDETQDDGSAPSHFKPSAATPSSEGNATDHKSTTKSRRDSTARRRKRGSKKSQQKRHNDSDDDSMCGIGFNTRIHEKTERDSDPYNVLEETSLQANDPSPKMPRKSVEAKGANVAGQFEGPEKLDEGGYDSDDRTEIFYETVTEDEYSDSENDADSIYDSDDQTQIFYESTDDEFESEEELEAGGISVSEAVQNLNNKSAVAKVKNLFGLRG